MGGTSAHRRRAERPGSRGPGSKAVAAPQSGPSDGRADGQSVASGGGILVPGTQRRSLLAGTRIIGTMTSR